MEIRRSSLSVGKIIRKVLTEDAEVQSKVTKVFPVVTDKALLPYIAYRREGFEPGLFKGGNADTVSVEIAVFSADYESGIDIAEAVRVALDGCQADLYGLRMRSCYLSDSDEGYQDDAYVQRLVFTIKV